MGGAGGLRDPLVDPHEPIGFEMFAGHPARHLERERARV